MQHKIDPLKYGPRGQVMADAIQSCVHCGFCLATCPTYRVLGQEMDSPRGRIYLMKSVLEERIPAPDAQPYIDRCLGCVACVPACPSGVPYGKLLLSYRGLVEVERKRPLLGAVAHKMIVETLPYPDRFRAAVKTSKIGKLTQRVLPGQFQAMLQMLPEKLPPAVPLPDIFPAKGQRRARVALLTGCVQQALAPEINWATVRVLAENGVETVIPKQQTCCGSILMHTGEVERAQALARQNLRAFPTDVDAIVTNAAGCGSGMKEYGLLFRGQMEEEMGQHFASKALDVAEFLAGLDFVPPPGFARPLSVAYQDACHLRHAQGVVSEPRHLLSTVPNLTVLELEDGGLCCGSAGTYNLEQPDIAHQLGQRKVERILATGAAAVVSGNIGCLTQIQTHLRPRGVSLPVYHTLELLDMAYRL
ncbi:MAG: 4Fe-4S dicluster domain-containing protein [Chloroflexi bacterium]|nr:4Fe-4S dicluster domain-containing protein [Chloroflexota bacterium]